MQLLFPQAGIPALTLKEMQGFEARKDYVTHLLPIRESNPGAEG